MDSRRKSSTSFIAECYSVKDVRYHTTGRKTTPPIPSEVGCGRQPGLSCLNPRFNIHVCPPVRKQKSLGYRRFSHGDKPQAERLRKLPVPPPLPSNTDETPGDTAEEPLSGTANPTPHCRAGGPASTPAAWSFRFRRKSRPSQPSLLRSPWVLPLPPSSP